MLHRWLNLNTVFSLPGLVLSKSNLTYGRKKRPSLSLPYFPSRPWIQSTPHLGGRQAWILYPMLCLAGWTRELLRSAVLSSFMLQSEFLPRSVLWFVVCLRPLLPSGQGTVQVTLGRSHLAVPLYPLSFLVGGCSWGAFHVLGYLQFRDSIFSYLWSFTTHPCFKMLYKHLFLQSCYRS